MIIIFAVNKIRKLNLFVFIEYVNYKFFEKTICIIYAFYAFDEFGL